MCEAGASDTTRGEYQLGGCRHGALLDTFNRTYDNAYSVPTRSYSRIGPLGLLWVFLVIFFPRDALAYLDPATLTMIGQLIVAGIATVLLFLKLGWRRVTGFFVALFRRDSRTESENTKQESGVEDPPREP